MLKDFPLLTSEDIEVKVKQISKTGALALLYKTARVDRKILNKVFGPLNWTSDYKVVKDNLYCGIGIREDSSQDFVWKWDCGIESRSDEAGNEKKGEASDAFKRAGFQVGIGEELYTAPFIWLNVATKATAGNKWALEDPFAKYVVTHIDYNKETRVITELDICNAKTNIKVFSYRMPTTGAMAQKMVDTMDTMTSAENTTEAEPIKTTVAEKKKKVAAPVKSVVTAESEENCAADEKKDLRTLISDIGHIVKKMYLKDGNAERYNEIIAEVTGDSTFKCNKATEEDYDTVLAIYTKLASGDYNG